MKMLRKLLYTVGAVLLATIWMSVPAQVNAAGTPLDTLPIVPPNQVTPSVFAPLASTQPGTDVNASNGAGLSEVSIDVNPTNRLNQVVVGHAPDLATMNTFYTTDGGATWTLVALGNAQDGLTSTFRFDPTVAFDDNGRLYVGYGVRLAGPTRRAVVVATSLDGGQTYSQFAVISTTNDIGNTPGNDKWHLATGPDPVTPLQQNVYIAWTQNVTETAGTDQRIVVSRSIDGGATFSAPLIINDASIAGTSAGNLFADPAVGPNGEVYVSWSSLLTGQIFIDRSLDGGLNWGVDNVVTTENVGFALSIPPQPDRGISPGPTLDTDRSGGPNDGRLYIAYTDRAAGGGANTNIFVRSSANGGVTWSAPTLVNDDGGTNSQFLPWLDVDQVTGTVSAAWYDARNDANNQRVQTFMAASFDGGATFQPNIQVSDGQSDQSVGNASRYLGNYLEYIGIAIVDCTASMVWADNSTNPAVLDYFTDQVHVPNCVRVNRPPDAICQDVTVNTDPGICTAAASVNNGSFDPDGDPITLVQAPPAPYNKGTTNVTLTVTDNQGASDSCTATVTVLDREPPALTCPAPQTVECTGSGSAVATYSATATDNCGFASTSCVPPSGSSFPLGTTAVTCSAVDDSKNSSSCSSSVTVVDTTKPVVSCVEGVNPSDKNVPKARNEDGFYKVSASDICTPPVIKIGSFTLASGETIKITQTPGKSGVRLVNTMGKPAIKHFQVGPNDAVITATDGSGNQASVTCLVPPPPK